MTTTQNLDLSVPGLGDVPVTFTDRGTGRPVLLLHGGGGPQTVTPWADAYAAATGARVIVPVHPGFGGTPRPDAVDSVAGLAAVQVALLDALDLTDVTVIGNSVGGWIAAETAILGSPRASGYVVVNAVGLAVPGHPVADFFALTPTELAELSWADPTGHVLDPAAMTDAERAVLAGNRAALGLYAGTTMTDPTLATRLATVTAPTLVVWGEADRVVDPEVGRAYAAAVPGARFTLIAGAGHLPQLEQPAAFTAAVQAFAPTTV